MHENWSLDRYNLFLRRAAFDYPKGQYTVTDVDSETFRECYRQGNTINEWASGHDVVALEKAGRRWFFSSLANHCDLGLEHVVNVAGGGARVPVAPGRRLIVRLILLRRLRSPVAVPPAIPPVSPGPAPGAPPPPSPETSSVTFNHCKIDEAAVAWAAVVAGAVVAAAFV